MRRGLWLLAAVIMASSALGAPPPPTVLWPPDGHNAGRERVWVVVRSPTPPQVLVDGRALPASARAEGVYHARASGLRPAGSRVVVETPGQTVPLSVTAAPGGTLFHSTPRKSCAACHDLGTSGCAECHAWRGSRHPCAQVNACGRCHQPGRPVPREVPGLCRGCHPQHAAGRHPKLRHPVSAPQDPARPGRPFDCASCHDPHAPVALGELDAEARRAWCKTCHQR